MFNLNADLRAAIMSAITRAGGCWIFKSMATTGSPGIMWGKRRYTVHRLLWNAQNGAIPGGKCLHRTCDSPHCVNPAHFELAPIGIRWRTNT